MSQLPLNALRVFESVVRHGSFREAAEELCVSQSAVSHQIRHLEQWFEAPLFDRSGSRPRALQRAEELADTLRHSLAEIRHACERARPSGSGSADLNIAAIPSIAVCWLIPHLSDFQTRYPDVAIRVIYAFHGQALNLDDIDFAFVYADGEPQIPGAQAHYLLPGASVPVCSPAIAATLEENDLLTPNKERVFLHDSNTLGWQDWFEQATGMKQSRPGPVFEDFNMLRAAVLAGQGIALCPPAMLQEDLHSARLVQLSNITVKDSWNYYLLEHDAHDGETVSPVVSGRVFDPDAKPASRNESAADLFKHWVSTLTATQSLPADTHRRE